MVPQTGPAIANGAPSHFRKAQAQIDVFLAQGDDGSDAPVSVGDTDTDPDARTDVRKKLRPRGFSLVLLDKDLKPVIRKPLPWEVREITHAIDKFPLRRQEIQQGAGSGAGG